MRTPLLSPPFRAEPKPRPFPTRGVPGGWHDPWDGDSLEAVVSALRQRNALRRQVIAAGNQLELLAQARTDGRWEAHVVSRDGTAARWPCTNGPTVTAALDALEAELRELLSVSDAVPDAQG